MIMVKEDETIEELCERVFIKPWERRAQRLLQSALSDIEHGNWVIDDVQADIQLAAACIEVVIGERDAREFDGYEWPEETEEEIRDVCICGYRRLITGGFLGACPVHGMGGRA